MSIYNNRTRTLSPAAPVEEDNSFLDKALHAVNIPGAAIAAGAKAYGAGEDISDAMLSQVKLSGPQVGWKDVLKQEGILQDSPLAQTALGFAGDVVLDPTNLLPFGLVTKGVKAASKATGVTKLLGKLGETGVAQDLGRKFIPHFDAPKVASQIAGDDITYRGQKSLLDMRRGGAAKAQQEEIYNILSKVPEADRKALPFIIEGTQQAANAVQTKAAQDVQAYLAKLAQREVAAGTLDPANVLQNYISYVMPKGDVGGEVWRRGLSAKSQFSQPRELKDWADALAHHAEPDPLKALQTRALVGGKTAATGEWMADVTTKFGQPTKLAADWKKVTIPGIVETSPLGQRLASTYFPPEVAQDLERVMKMGGEERGATAELFQRMTGLWKMAATSMNPGFHVRNFISNGWLMSTAGLNPVEVTNALARGMTQTGISKKTLAEAERFGIFAGGHFGELQDEAAKSVLSKLNVGRKVGDKVEHGARLGLFDHFIRKGMTAEQAAMKVRDHLFNYDELTDVEKNIRRYAIPFYTWMRKAAPLVAKSYVDNPKLWAQSNDLMVALENAAKDVGSFEPLQEAWAQDNIQLPAGDGGTRTMTNPFPMTEFNRLPGPQDDSAMRWGQRTGSMLGPHLKVPLELMFNTSMFTGQPIVKDPTFGTPANENTLASMQTAYAPTAKAIAQLMGMPKDKAGRQQAPAGLDYFAQQVPFVGPTVVSPIQTGQEEGLGAAVEDVLGLTRTQTAKERGEKRQRLQKRKREADKTKHRLDKLAERAGAQ